jgi:hypothetical protein
MATLEIPGESRQIERVRAREAQIIQQARSRGLVSQIWTVLLQPGVFFRTLPAIDNTRQWFWVALIILAFVGLSAVQHQSITSEASAPPAPPQMPPVDGPGGPAGPGVDFGGPPPGVVPGGPPAGGADATGGAESTISTNWTTALIAASGVLLGWVIQAVLLCEVTLFRGFAPRLGRNFQIAIWAGLPLGLLALIQFVYYAAGGTPGEPGLSGLVVDLPEFATLSPLVQALLISLASQITIFSIWSLLLLYSGARYALRGRWWSSMLVVVAWVALVTIVPVVLGTVEVPEAEVTAPMDLPPGFDMPIPPEAGQEMPGGRSDLPPAPEERLETAPASEPGE